MGLIQGASAPFLFCLLGTKALDLSVTLWYNIKIVGNHPRKPSPNNVRHNTEGNHMENITNHKIIDTLLNYLLVLTLVLVWLTA